MYIYIYWDWESSSTPYFDFNCVNVLCYCGISADSSRDAPQGMRDKPWSMAMRSLVVCRWQGTNLDQWSCISCTTNAPDPVSMKLKRF